MEDRFKNFTVLVSSISRHIRRIKTEEMKTYNLKSPHVSCLYYIYKEEVLTAKELCDICDEDKAAISRSLDFLENNGFLICDNTMKKKYRSQITLTEKGKNIGKEIDEKINKLVNVASVGLKDEERVILYKCLNIINDNLNKIFNEEKGE